MAGLAGKNLKDTAFVEEATNSLTHIKGLTIEPLKPEYLTNAADLVSAYKIDCEDALHLATATRIKAQQIITNDKDFSTTPIKPTI